MGEGLDPREGLHFPARVPFSLRVSQGGETESFSFEGGEVRLGRTADNDIVIRDPASSRSHARLFEQAGQYFVEDLKSANGTILNARPLKGTTQLESGDRILIGDVELVFELPESNDTMIGSSTVDEGSEDPEPTADPNQTILKPQGRPGAIVRKPAPRRQLTPPPEPVVDEPGPSSTAADEEDDQPLDGDDEASPSEEVEVDNSTRNFEVPPPRALQRRAGTAAPAKVSRAREADPQLSLPTAAGRARQRRELQKTSSGRLVLMWNDLPRAGKIAVGTLFFGTAAALLTLAGFAVVPRKHVEHKEPVSLTANADPVRDSFGEGDDVDFSRPDMKSFSFSYASPTAIVGVLHYQARDCGKDEVSIELNGVAIENVPADTVDAVNRQLETVLPAAQLKVGEENDVTFDNLLNPPGDETWRVWNVWVEIIPIPQMSPEEASRRAKEEIERAQKYYDLRDVGAMNLFRSWKEFRLAWLLLEATPNRPPELLQLAYTRMNELRPELDRKCSAMLVDYQQQMNKRQPDYDSARKVLQNIPSNFEKEHWCFGASRALLADLDEFNDVEE